MVNVPEPHTTPQNPAGGVAHMKTTMLDAVTAALVIVFVFPPAPPHVVAVATVLPALVKSR